MSVHLLHVEDRPASDRTRIPEPLHVARNLLGSDLPAFSMEGLGSPHSPPPSSRSLAEAFSQLLAGLPQKKTSEAAKFVKRLDEILVISLSPETPIQVALSLPDRALIDQFTGLWPSPKSTENWVNRNWAPLIKENVNSYFLGRGFFLFDFTTKEDKELIFHNGPYFTGP